MGKYSNDSDSSSYSRKKKSWRKRSSSRSSSSSRYSSRSKKSKKSKKHRRSRSSERSSKHRRRSRDRSSSSKARKSQRSKHSRRHSRSSSRSKHSSNRSPSFSSRSHSKDKRSPSYSRSRRRDSRSPSYSSKSNEKKSSIFDGAELLAKLNRAATEAMSENSKKLEKLFSDNPENRSNAIDEINAPSFVQKAFCSNDRKDDTPLVAEVSNFVSFNNVKEEPGSLLHPNLLIEDQVEKTNRWVKKLFQIRQKALYGDSLLLD